MQVEILKNGNYKEFEQSAGMRAQQLTAGAVVDFPESYANYLITAGLAKLRPAAPDTKPLTPVEKAAPAPAFNRAVAPDPGSMTVAEIKSMELSNAGWQALLAAEEAGKGRKSVIEWAETKLAE